MLNDPERTRRIPVTIDEATQDPETEVVKAPSTVPNPADKAKPTLYGGSSDLNKTLNDAESVERILAGLEWTPPESDPKLAAATIVAPPAAPSAPAPATPRASPSSPGTNPGLAPATFAPAHEPAAELTRLGGSATALGIPAAQATALGVPVSQVPAFPATPEPPPPARGPTFGRTMIGGSVTAAEVLAESTRRVQAEAAPPREPLKTMVGHAVMDQPAFDSSPQLPPAAPSSQAPDPQAFRPAFKTMLGVALPGIAPIRDSERALQAAPASSSSPVGTLHGGVLAPSSSQQRIAPPQPMTAPFAAPPPQYAAPVPPPPQSSRPLLQAVPPVVPPPAPIVEEPLPAAPRAAQKKGLSAVVLVSILVVVVIAMGTAAAVVMLRAGAPLSAKARLDESGKESLEIHCESCPNDTKITLGAAEAMVTDATAVLPLTTPLAIGENNLDIAIDRPGAGRDETVKVHVPIAYRVKADLTTLTLVPPQVTVRVEAGPGTEVIVDEKPVALDGAGRGSYSIDVSADALGPSDEQKAIDRKIPFSVKRKGAAAPEPGTLVVRAAIVPLHIDAPGIDLITDKTTANIVGQTKPGGAVTVDGQALALDGNGRFAIRAELPADGEKVLTLVATAPPLAPRTVRAKVTRVASLEAQTKVIDATTPLGFDAYGPDPGSKLGSMVAINGEVVEIRSSPGYAVMVVEEKKSCAAGGGCILRLSMGEDVKAVRGDTIRAYGHVAGTVAWNNKTVPAVTGTLAITAKGTKK